MSKKKFITTEIILIVTAIIGIVCGIFYYSIVGAISNALYPSNLDMLNLNDSNLENSYRITLTDNAMISSRDSYILSYYSDDDDSTDGSIIELELSPEYRRKIQGLVHTQGTIRGTIHKSDETRKEFILNEIVTYQQAVYEYYASNPDTYEIAEMLKVDDEFIESIRTDISPYYIELVSVDTSISVVPQVIIYTISILLILTSLILLVTRLSKKPAWQIALGFVAIILVISIIFGIILNRQIRTITSVENKATELYSMNCHEDLKIDELLESDISTIDDVINWIIQNQLYGFPVQVDYANIGCSAFTSNTPDGDVLFARNFDYYDTDTLVVYSNPEDGYASYSVCDLSVFDVGTDGIDPMSLEGRIYMLAAPYMCLDGMNEAGLGVGILELTIEELHQDQGKPDLLIYCAIRALLDRCANVDEAIDFLSKYDIHTSLDVSYHLYITDKTGRAVVIEWLDNEMIVNELNSCTNSVLTPGEHFDEGSPDERIQIIDDTLNVQHNGELSFDETRDLIAEVSQDLTEWTCIYNLTDFTFTIYIDGDFENEYTFPNN